MGRRLFVEAHRALVGELLGDGEAVRVPVATVKSRAKTFWTRQGITG